MSRGEEKEIEGKCVRKAGWLYKICGEMHVRWLPVWSLELAKKKKEQDILPLFLNLLS